MWGFYLEVYLVGVCFRGGYSQEMMGLVFRVLFFECHSSQMFWCSRNPWSPSGCIRRCEDGSRFTNCHERTVSVGDSSKFVWCSRSPWSPSYCIRWGEYGSNITHSNEYTISVGSTWEKIWCSRSPIIPSCSIRWGDDGYTITKCHEGTVSEYDISESIWSWRSTLGVLSLLILKIKIPYQKYI